MRKLPVRPIVPGPGQESVWDYPRPPALEQSDRRVVVRVGSVVIADSTSAWRVMETSHPPTWYLPRADVVEQYLRRSAARSSICEWKGAATYWDVLVPGRPVHRRPSAGATRRRLRGSCRSPGTCRSCQVRSTARSTASGCCRRPAASTAAGSPLMWSGRSRVNRAPGAGSPTLVGPGRSVSSAARSAASGVAPSTGGLTGSSASRPGGQHQQDADDAGPVGAEQVR